MHFVILGAGALGSILAAHLARAGHRVQLVARAPRATVVRAQGLRITGLTDFTAGCEVLTDATGIAGADALIVTVKTYDTRAALAPFGATAADRVCSVQNGVLKNTELARIFGEARVIGAMADFSGELLESGAVAFTRNVCLHLGEPAGGASARVASLVAAIDAAGIRCREAPAIESIEWSKFTGWVGVMLVAVLTRLETWRFLSDPDAARVITAITREVAGIAARLGIPLVDISPIAVGSIIAGPLADGVAAVQAMGARFFSQAPEHRMSSLQDVLRGRPLEIDETAGDALARGRALGVAMPALEACYGLARAVDRAVRAPDRDSAITAIPGT